MQTITKRIFSFRFFLVVFIRLPKYRATPIKAMHNVSLYTGDAKNNKLGTKIMPSERAALLTFVIIAEKFYNLQLANKGYKGKE